MTTTTATADSQQRVAVPHVSRWLRLARRAWLVLAIALFAVFVVSVPGAYRMIQTPCDTQSSDCQWAQPTPEYVAELEGQGIPLSAYSMYVVALFTAVSLVFWAVAMLVYIYRPDQWFALMVAHLLVLLGSGGVSLVFTSATDYTDLPVAVMIAVGWLTIPVYQFISLFLLTFPNGKLYGVWNFFPFVLMCLNTLFWLLPASAFGVEDWPGAALPAWLLVVFGSHIVVQVIRYRRMYTPIERQQTKWLIYSFCVPLAALIIVSILTPAGVIGALPPLLDTSLVVTLYLPIGVGVGIALLRYRLWDIDIIINRTVVYALLSAVIVGVYALIVSALGSLVQDRSSFGVSLIGAGAVAVTFQPMRMTLQRGVNRVMFGKRDEPIAVMSELGKALDNMLSPSSALAYLTERTAKTLKLPYVEIVDTVGHQTVTFGTARGKPFHFPLIYQGNQIGDLVTCSRSANEKLNAADRVLLENVARQASSVIYSARLASDLQESRQRIVTAREEERRRLRRDLHDGLGPTLAAITLQAEAARDVLSENPTKSEEILDKIIERTQDALADIRRVVYALRPPALDDLGLLPAMRALASNHSTLSTRVTVAPLETLPALPAAVEVAAYRIVQEALTNVSRHADAKTCHITVTVDSDLYLAIEDDGHGIPANHTPGVGLNSMHERAAELGGVCTVESRPGRGTCIRARLPLGAARD